MWKSVQYRSSVTNGFKASCGFSGFHKSVHGFSLEPLKYRSEIGKEMAPE
jgi:hypothetical protein